LLAQQDLRPALSTKGAKQKRRQVSRGPDPAKKMLIRNLGRSANAVKSSAPLITLIINTGMNLILARVNFSSF